MQAVTPVPQEVTTGRSKEIPVVYQIHKQKYTFKKFAQILAGKKIKSKCTKDKTLIFLYQELSM